MTQKARKSEVYTVVEVWRGIAVSVKNFRGLSNAQRCAKRLRRHRNLVEDDVQVFQSSIRS